ncbi:hypothetical protein ASE92_17315 [Pedobacter sp. Leaf41]|uniref:DUF3871 family protein n=1 Tax=Pedobacter sp. Leaf41 TaxID=1736218 RepID=UPI000702E422|nr:DUF3871 family protein [Pedobacter sp. Leaf41]KQN32365.1 hypothetical protein ASE92_17315 [Pedobacter sp. Leaf41]
MEVLKLVDNYIESPFVELSDSSPIPFIVANTISSTAKEIKDQHLIPVFVKDNQPVISQADFINLTGDIAKHIFQREVILEPSVRVSYPIKGRIPDAKEKPAHLLLEEEKTIYYERMAFALEIPSISDNINGNRLNLTIGGIKAYNLDNLYSKKGSDERFKIFIGFQNKVCTNMCISTDGLIADLKVRSLNELTDGIYNLIENYNAKQHLDQLKSLTKQSLTEHQFAQLIGKAKMYQHLPPKYKKHLQELSFGDTQISIVVKDYYQDESFCREDDGSINMWKLYNLFTGANKASYIDTFLDRGLNAFSFTNGIANSLSKQQNNWFIN